MTIVFDEERAVQHKRVIDKKTQEENNWRETKEIIINISLALIHAFLLAGVLLSNTRFRTISLIFSTGILIAFLVPVLYRTLLNDFKYINSFDALYSPDVQYLTNIQGKTVCDFYIDYQEDTADIFLTIEENLDATEEMYIGHFKQEHTSTVTDITIDLENSVMYIPIITEGNFAA